MLMLPVHHHDPCDRLVLLGNSHGHAQAVKRLWFILQLAIAFHSDPVARHHLTFYHTDCHQKAKHIAFVLFLSPVVLILTPTHKMVC